MPRRRTALQQRRRAAGHSQESLAAELGVERTTIARWEAGTSTPHPWQRPRIARALDIATEAVEVLLTTGSTHSAVEGARAQHPQPSVNKAAPIERAYELYVRGHALLAENHRPDIEAAKILLDRATSRDPSFARAIAARGYATWRQYFAGWVKHADALSSAIDDVRTALNADPDSVTAHLTFVRVCWDLGWHEQGLKAGLSVHQRHPDSLDATITYARALNNAGLAEHAIPLLRGVLAVDPTSPSAAKLAVWCHMLTGHYERAVELCRQHLARHPHDSNTRWAAALAARHLPDGVPAALALAKEACETDPDDVTHWTLIGYLHRADGNPDTARAAWARGIDHMTTNGTDTTNLRILAWTANLYAAVGVTTEALGLLDRIVESQPDNGYLTYRRAHVLAELGQLDDAVRTLDEAVTQGFLSGQLLAHEEVLALAPLVGRSDYQSVIRRLSHRIATCRAAFAPGLPAAPITPPLQLLGGTP